MRELFYQFLVKNGALFNYLKYVSFNSHSFERVSINHWVSLTNMTETISWRNSDEGFDYWNKLDDKWFEYINNTNKL